MLSRFSLATLLFFCGGALAQTAPLGVPPSLEVTRLAPQLLAFAGSQANLDALVSSLTAGSTATLTSTLGDGSTQVVTFTPGSGGLTPTQIAQTLEQARQQLIGRGIAAPTAQQLGVTLVGGALPTPSGVAQVSGLAPVNAAAGGSAFSAPLTVQTRPAAAVANGTANSVGTNVAGGNISNSPLPRGISDTPPPPNNQPVAPPAINAPQQPMVTPPSAPATGPRSFR